MKNLTKQLINIRLLLTKNGMSRGRYLKKKGVFKEFGDNVRIATNVLFLEHDVISGMLNIKYKTQDYKDYLGTIEIGNNTFIRRRSNSFRKCKNRTKLYYWSW